MQLLERVEKILKHYNVSKTKFANILDIPQTTLWRYFSEEHQDKFTQYLWKILEVYPEISKYWLFFGEGDMLHITQNYNQDKPNDDLAYRITYALEHREISKEEVIKKTGINEQLLDRIYNNEVYPSFTFIQKLYEEFALNPTYLLNGNAYIMFEMRTDLERVRFLADHEQRQHITYRTIERWFGCSKEEAKEFLKDYNEGERVVPYDWRAYFADQLIFNHGWIANSKAPMTIFHEKPTSQRNLGENSTDNEEIEKSA